MYHDGGLLPLANNPAYQAILEANRLWPERPIDVLTVIGCGDFGLRDTGKATPMEWIGAHRTMRPCVEIARIYCPDGALIVCGAACAYDRSPGRNRSFPTACR